MSSRSERRGGAGHYFSLGQIASIASGCFDALAHMHAHGLTHTDLKPENILLLSSPEKGALPPSPEVALIDFGGATWKKKTKSRRDGHCSGSIRDSCMHSWSLACSRSY